MSPTNLTITVILLSVTGVAKAQPAQRVDRHGDPLPAGAIARLGSLRFRHDLPLRYVHYSPDGKTLLANAETHAESRTTYSGHLWDADSGKLIPRFRNAPVGYDAVFSPDGKLLVDIDENFVARIWDFATGKVVTSFGVDIHPDKKKADPDQAETWKVHWAYFSVDGKTLVLNGPRKDVEILRRFRVSYSGPGGAVRFKELRAHHFMGINGGSVDLATSADAAMLANAGALVDLETGKKFRDLEEPSFDNNGLVTLTYHFCPDGKTIIGHGFETNIGIWDIATGKLLRTIDGGRNGFRVRQQPISPDGKWIAANDGNDFKTFLYELATGKLVWAFSNGGQNNRSWFSPNSKLLATCSDGARNFCVWDVATGKEVCRFNFHYHSSTHVGGGMAWSPDSKRIALTSGTIIKIVDVATGKFLDPDAGHDEPPRALLCSPDGKTLSAGGFDGGMRDWNPNTGQQVKRYPDYDRWAALGLRRDGRLLLAYEDHWSLSVWDVRADKRLQIIDPDEAWYRTSAFSADSSLIAYHDATASVWIHDAATGKKLHHFTTGFDNQKHFTDLPPMMAFSPDGRTFAALGWTKKQTQTIASMNVWELATGKVRKCIQFDDTAGFGDWAILKSGSPPLQFLPDNKTFSIATNRSVCLYSIATGKELRRFDRDGLVGFGAAFSPDGRMLAAPDRHGKIFVWDSATATLLTSFDCGSTHATLLAFAPDCKRLASAGIDGIVMIWDLEYFLKKAVRHPNEMEKAWLALADSDADRAFQAMTALAEHPHEALTVLKKHLRPAALPDAKEFDRLLDDLCSPRFAVRQEATNKLEKLHELAEPGLKKALAAARDIESRRRLEDLLDRLAERTPSPALVRILRAIEVLEQIGSAEARELLQTQANGMPEYRGTLAAAAALERMQAPSIPPR